MFKSLQLLLFFIAVFSTADGQHKDPVLFESLKKHISYLSSDDLEGRDAGSEGEKKAYTYISAEFLKLGLEKKGHEGSFLHQFDFVAGRYAGEQNELRIGDKVLVLDKDYYPTSWSGNGGASGSLVYVGFGIQAPEKEHDDYAGFKRKQLEGKIFVLEISSPDGMHPHSAYGKYSDTRSKLELAKKMGAAAVLFVNNDEDVKDPEAYFQRSVKPVGFPVVFINNDALADVDIKAKKLEASIKCEVITDERTAHNVVGYLNNNKELTVVIGAHYDHLGYGGHGSSLYKGENEMIHNGADDNASGTAGIIEIAKNLKSRTDLKYNYLFIGFSAEEKGLFGSKAYVADPTIDLSTVNYMINFDMIGRFDTSKNTLAVNGTGTSPWWEPLLESIKIGDVNLKTSKSGIGPSDHTSFYLKDLPVLHFFTGTHSDYHKPSDDEDKINYEGIELVLKYTMAVIDSAEKKDSKIEFSKTKDGESGKAPRFTVTLGVIPDYMFDGEGMRIDGVTEGKPASKAGIIKGDVVQQLGEFQIKDMMGYMGALSKFKKGDKTSIKYLRGEEVINGEIQF